MGPAAQIHNLRLIDFSLLWERKSFLAAAAFHPFQPAAVTLLTNFNPSAELRVL